jgi:hypothetical protein
MCFNVLVKDADPGLRPDPFPGREGARRPIGGADRRFE